MYDVLLENGQPAVCKRENLRPPPDEGLTDLEMLCLKELVGVGLPSHEPNPSYFCPIARLHPETGSRVTGVKGA